MECWYVDTSSVYILDIGQIQLYITGIFMFSLIESTGLLGGIMPSIWPTRLFLAYKLLHINLTISVGS